jgi:glutathione S-transferase
MARKAKRAATRGQKGKTSRAAKRKVTAKKALPAKRAEMIDLFTDTTPNGYKISILLEELGQPYAVVPVDIGAGDQFKPEFRPSAPTTRSAITDRNGPQRPRGGSVLAVRVSAILLYLAEKTGKFLKTERGRLMSSSG